MNQRLNSNKIILFTSYTLIFILFTFTIFHYFSPVSFIAGEDGIDQYYPVFIYVGNYLRSFFSSILHGSFSIKQFDFSIGLGDDVLSPLNYYGFGNPFYIISVFFPGQYSDLGYSVLIFLQLFVAGLSYIYYCDYKKISYASIIASVFPYVFSMVYAQTYGFWYPPYILAMISFPIMCRGLEVSINEDRISKGFILAIFLQGISQFYHTYMILIFAAIYGIIIICHKTKKINCILSYIILLFKQVLLALGMSALTLLPCIYGFLNSTRTEKPGFLFMINKLIKYETTRFPRLIGNLILPNSYDTQSVELQLPFFCAFIIVLLIKEIDDKAVKRMLYLLFIMYFLNSLTSYILEGFPDNVYFNRWAFALSFFISIAFGLSLDKISHFSFVRGFITLVIFGLYTVFTIKMKYVGRGSFRSNYKYFGLIIGIGLILFAVTSISYRKYAKYVILIANLVLMLYIQKYMVTTLNQNGSFTIRDETWNLMESTNGNVYKSDDYFSRSDIPVRVINQSLVQNYNGTAEYFSIIPKAKADFFNAFGIDTRTIFMQTDLHGIDAIEDLLSVEYYLDSTGKLIKNDDYIPFGTTFTTVISEAEYDLLSIEEKQKLALSALVIKDQNKLVHDYCIVDHTSINNCTPINRIPYNHMTNLTFTDNSISGEIELSNSEILFLSITNSKGWTAYIDKNKSPLLVCDYGFTALELPSGKHHIELRYHTPYLVPGFIISIISFIIFLKLAINKNTPSH